MLMTVERLEFTITTDESNFDFIAYLTPICEQYGLKICSISTELNSSNEFKIILNKDGY